MTAAAKKLCFVIGPIGDADTAARVHADWLLEGIIEPVMAKIPQFDVKRADHDPRPGLIDAQMINDLLNADLVIADLSFSNPNAFYEIGIRHMAQKPIIHMQLKDEKPPFDLSLYRSIKFSRLRVRDLEEAKIELTRTVEAVLAEDYQIENPVTHARGKVKLDEHATSGQKVILDQLDAQSERIEMLEDQLRFILAPQPAPNPFSKLMRPPTVYGGGEARPFTTMITFTKEPRLTGKITTAIMEIIGHNYGSPTQIAKNDKSLTLLIPADATIDDLLRIFAGWEGLEVAITKRS